MTSQGGKPRKNQNNMKTRILKLTPSSALMAIAALTIAFSLASAQRADENRPSVQTVEGVWQVTRMGVNCQNPNQHGPPFPFLMTFHSDGTLSAFGNAPGGGPFDTPEAGVWQREPGAQNYSFRDVSYGYDENGAFAGSGVVTANVHLTGANSFTYGATIQFFDADGNLIFTACGRATGTRFE
jgi:hypothetical protein